MLKKFSTKARLDLDLAQDWRQIALCSGSRTPSPPQNEAAFDLTPANKPDTHIYSRALSGGRGGIVTSLRGLFSSLYFIVLPLVFFFQQI
jgi:hypothetical protein